MSNRFWFWRLAVVAVALVCPPAASAVNRVWIRGAGTGIWSNGANWSPTGAPQPNDSVFVTAADSFTKVAAFDSSSFGMLNQFSSINIDESGPGTIKLLQISEDLQAGLLRVGLS